jgi:hypothetical protein
MMRKSLFVLTVALGSLGLLIGCQLTQSSRFDAPLHRLQQSVAAASPFGVRWVSPNRREFHSEYFLQSGDKFREAKTLPQRMFAHWYVLGDRRPYRVEVEVVVERRTGRGEYSKIGTSAETAARLWELFRKKLDERLEERNIIDDYKAF